MNLFKILLVILIFNFSNFFFAIASEERAGDKINSRQYEQILENYIYQKKKIKIAVNNFCIPMGCRIDKNIDNAKSQTTSNVKKENEFFYKRYLYKSMLNSDISEETASKIIDSVKKVERVKSLDKSQPEVVLNLEKYLKIVGFDMEDVRFNADKILQYIKEKYLQNKQDIDTISYLIGIDKEVLLSIWYSETRCGRIRGNFNVLDALYTLALDGRRRDFFEKEFIITAKLIDLKYLDINAISSWAGAIGDFQTMPSTTYGSYMSFGENQNSYDKNFQAGLATGAHYLYRTGFATQMPILLEVKFDKNFNMCTDGGFKNKKKVSQFLEMGVKIIDESYKNSILKHNDFLNLDAMIINPDCNIDMYQVDNNEHQNAKFYMIFDNYLSILSWNKSNLYATSIGLIANKIRMSKEFF